ncbi:uracil-DNA glycosylase family protein, clostridial type [Paenibacillus sp. JCM 10914]|nr:uracil-DNA glycosylase family protein, clostridial type [Paenibacillus sp. JCM 10914]
MDNIQSAVVDPNIIALCRARLAHEPVEGFLLGRGTRKAKVMFVGEAPGASEVMEGRPFAGQAGKEMDMYLDRLALTRAEVYMTSTMRSRPYKEKTIVRADGQKVISRSNRTPTKVEIMRMRRFWMKRLPGCSPGSSLPWEISRCTGSLAVMRLSHPYTGN